jgi:hypothetical protein
MRSADILCHAAPRTRQNDNAGFALSLAAGAVALLCVIGTPAAAGPLPNASITPGAIRPDLSLSAICGMRWGKDARHVSARMRRDVFRAYGLSGPHDQFCEPKGCELDHLISRELGGADDVRNLWPQSRSGPWNSKMKDRLENRLHREVCAGRITLEDAQRGEIQDWTAQYREYFGAR